MVFTASISNAFSSLFDNVAPGVSAEVSPSSDALGAGVDNRIVDELSSRKSELGINRLVTDVRATVTVAGGDGKAISTGGAPAIASAFTPPDEALAPDADRIMPGGRARKARARSRSIARLPRRTAWRSNPRPKSLWDKDLPNRWMSPWWL